MRPERLVQRELRAEHPAPGGRVLVVLIESNLADERGDEVAAGVLTDRHALEMDRRIGIRFTDTGEAWTLWVRRGVLEPVPRLLDDLEMHLEVDSVIWKKMLGRQRNPAAVIAKDIRFIKGGRVAFTRFMLLFSPLREAPEPAPLANNF